MYNELTKDQGYEQGADLCLFRDLTSLSTLGSLQRTNLPWSKYTHVTNSLVLCLKLFMREGLKKSDLYHSGGG